ncbi:hypothetical protein BLNAU_23712 [Blattamonas nauphoetae]|uniref:Uncharacterized protein n=1 Tax=Blattamonas nauphoetae TaxID=2049346 RepID=A0ABQ9WPE8_9EUKA|nr:hypothetical protein BLNAU_23712 [Blattamonas nauphoetae]
MELRWISGALHGEQDKPLQGIRQFCRCFRPELEVWPGRLDGVPGSGGWRRHDLGEARSVHANVAICQCLTLSHTHSLSARQFGLSGPDRIESSGVPCPVCDGSSDEVGCV